MNVDIIDEPLMEFLLQQNQFLSTRKLVYKLLLFEWEDQVQVQNDEQ